MSEGLPAPQHRDGVVFMGKVRTEGHGRAKIREYLDVKSSSHQGTGWAGKDLKDPAVPSPGC